MTNDGEADLNNVTVTDPAAPSCEMSLGTLTAGASTSYSCTLAGATSDFTNVATVTGTDSVGNTVTASDDAFVNVLVPAINVAKAPETQQTSFGGDAVFAIEVTNTGDVDLFNVVVSDPLTPDCEMDIGDLAVGDTTSYTCTATGLEADFTNIAIATGEDAEGNVVTDEDDAFVDVLAPAIEIQKSPDDQTILAGQNVTFTITVTNTGDVDLFNIVVGDPLLPQCDRGIDALRIGETWTYDCTTEFVLEPFTNVAIVTAEDDEGNRVTDEDDAIVRIREPEQPELPVTGADDSPKLVVTGLIMVLLGAAVVRFEQALDFETR